MEKNRHKYFNDFLLNAFQALWPISFEQGKVLMPDFQSYCDLYLDDNDLVAFLHKAMNAIGSHIYKKEKQAEKRKPITNKPKGRSYRRKAGRRR